jgi:hypothetical protein
MTVLRPVSCDGDEDDVRRARLSGYGNLIAPRRYAPSKFSETS